MCYFLFFLFLESASLKRECNTRSGSAGLITALIMWCLFHCLLECMNGAVKVCCEFHIKGKVVVVLGMLVLWSCNIPHSCIWMHFSKMLWNGSSILIIVESNGKVSLHHLFCSRIFEVKLNEIRLFLVKFLR